MSAFVDTTRLAVTEGDNTIYIKPRMDFGTKSRVQDALARISSGSSTAGDTTILVTIGAQNLALMVHNIVAWDGPAFTDQQTGKLAACTPANIERLDPDLPLVEAVLARISEVNLPRGSSPNGTASTASGTPEPAASLVDASLSI